MLSSPAEISPDISLRDLVRVFYEHHEPWDSIAQCRVFLRAARMLHHKEPSEAERDGMRVSKRDIADAIKQCQKQLGVLQLCRQPGEVIVTPDQMR